MAIIEPIETKRLILREFAEDDFEDIYKFKSDPKVVKYLTWGPSSREETLTSLRSQISFQNETKRQLYILAVVLKNTKSVIGNALFMIRNNNFDTAEIGFFLNSDFWRNGYGKEIVEGLLEFGFCKYNIHRIYAVCDVENKESVNLLQKVGFRLEGHFIKDLKVKGEWRDNFLLALLKEEYNKC